MNQILYAQSQIFIIESSDMLLLLIQISFDWKNKAASKITRQQQNYDSPKPTYLFIRVQREWVTPIFLPIKSLVVRFNNIIYHVYHRATDT